MKYKCEHEDHHKKDKKISPSIRGGLLKGAS